jgi:predicted aspartyl protease
VKRVENRRLAPRAIRLVPRRSTEWNGAAGEIRPFLLRLKRGAEWAFTISRMKKISQFSGIVALLAAMLLSTAAEAQVANALRFAQSGVPAQQAETKKASPDKITAAKLDLMFLKKRYVELERSLPAAQLSAVDRQYFEGMLANLRNDVPRSIELLSKAVPELQKANSPRTARAMRLLANSYVRAYRYTDSAKLYSDLVAKYADAFERGEKKSLEDDAATVALLDGAPAQTVEGATNFAVPWHRSKIGSMDVDATVGDEKVSWLVDTGANYSVLIESAAKRLNVKLSEKTASTQGITGDDNPLRIGMVPEMKLGTATIKNIAVLVIPDKNLNVNFGGKGSYQIEAILGFPVLEALGRITLTTPGGDAGEMRVEKSTGSADKGSAMYIEEMEPLLAAKIGSRDVIFAFDTGADSTMFTMKYYNEFAGDLMNLAKSPHGVGGAGGAKAVAAVHQPKVEIQIGGTTDVLSNATVITERMGTHLDSVNANMGRDALEKFESATIDFRTMKFELGATKK